MRNQAKTGQETGRLAALKTVRDQLAAALADSPSARDLPGLSREYRQVLKAIALAEAEHKPEGGVIDEITRRRAAKTAVRARRQAQ